MRACYCVWLCVRAPQVDMMDVVSLVMDIMEGKTDGRPSFMETIHHTDAFATKKVRLCPPPLGSCPVCAIEAPWC